MVTTFVGVFTLFVGMHVSSLGNIEFMLTKNALALDHCSTALSALAVSKQYPINCKLVGSHWEQFPAYTNNFIHSITVD